MSDLLPNLVRFSGSPQAIKTLKKDCCKVEEGSIALDFEKILQIPEDIDERKKDWLLEHWGADWYGDFEIVSDTSKRLVLRFSTIGGPPVGIYARCTSLVSGLSVEAKCLDDPSGHASKVVAKDGVATLSDDFFIDRAAPFDWRFLYENKKPERRGRYGTGKPVISSLSGGIKLSLYDDILRTTVRRADSSKIVAKDIKRSLRDRTTIKQNIENYLRGSR